MLVNVRRVRVNQLLDVAERTTANALVRDFPEPTLNQVQPRTGGRREAHMNARVSLQPPLDFRVLVRRVVVDNQMQARFAWRLRVNQSQELDPLLVSVTRHARADQSPFRHCQRRELRGGPVAFVVVCQRPATALLHWQARLRTVQDLDLTLLIRTACAYLHADRIKHQGMFRWVEIESYDVDQFLHKTRACPLQSNAA